MEPGILEGMDYERNQKTKQDIWKLLVERGGAAESMEDQFMSGFPCPEFRFQGRFGFGGKIRYRNRTVSVDYYPEDKNEMRERLESILNAELSKYRFY